MKHSFVYKIFLLMAIFILAGCSSFVQDIKAISNTKEYTVSFFAPGCEGRMASIKADYQEKIILPDCAFKNPDVSQIFAGWSISADEKQVFYPDDGEIEVTNDISLYARWMDKDKSRYKVIHLFQNLDDDDYTEDTELAQDLLGYDGALTEAKPLDVYGFTADQSFEQVIIDRNAKPVQKIQIYYTRNEYTISFDHNGDFDNIPTMDSDTITARYQKMVTLPECKFTIHESKKFAGWSEEKDKNDDIEFINKEEIEVTRDMVLYAHSEPENYSEYKVIHLFQNIDDDGYTEDPHRHQILEGKDDELTEAKPLTEDIDGFTPVTPIEQKTIVEDNAEGPKTIVEIKYNRKKVTLTFDLDGGTMTSEGLSGDNKLVLKYGSKVTPVVKKEGYKFTGWTPSLPDVAVADGHYKAEWVKSYTYNLESAEGGLLGTSTVEQGAIAKESINNLPNTSELYIVPMDTVAIIDTDGSLIWDPKKLGEEEIHVHGAFIKNRKIELSPYIMSQYPVTLKLYETVMGKHNFVTTGNPTAPSHDNNPVNNVTWYDAVIFCNKLSIMEGLEPVYYIYEYGENVYDTEKWPIKELNTFKLIRGDHTKNGYRLPTNAEWEFAARGGDPSKEDWHYAFSGKPLVPGEKLHKDYKIDENLNKVAIYQGFTQKIGPWDVGLRDPNRLKLYDMSGGICEWTYDFMNEDCTFDDTPYLKDGIAVNPKGTEEGTIHSLRGGSYFSYAFYCTVTYLLTGKDKANADIKKYSYGFRLCRNAE